KEAPIQQVMEYCCRDVADSTELYKTLLARLDNTEWLDYFLTEEAPFTSVLLGMEVAGMPYNIELSESLRGRLELEADTAKVLLLDQADLPPSFNVNSGPMLSAYLFHKVFELKDVLVYNTDVLDCLKSCVAGEHEDCELGG